MNRNCKNSVNASGQEKKQSSTKLNSNKSPPETSKSKKLKSLNDSIALKNEPEISTFIKFNYAQPSSNNSSVSKTKKSSKGLVNHDYCSYCDEGGDLLNCDRCPASFHLLCSEPPLTLDQIPNGEFLCNKCNSKAELMAKENNLDTSNLPEINLPISNETKTIKFEIEDDEPALETLIRMAKSLNPRQMQLSSDLNMQCAFDLPGLNKIKWWTKDGNKIVNPISSTTLSENLNAPNLNSIPSSLQINNDMNDSSSTKNKQNKNGCFLNLPAEHYSNRQFEQSDLCFICVKNGKENQLVKCDFCTSRYHLDCLNPPLCSMPARDRLWMCPNHMENFLDQNILESDRLTKRINLWKKFSLAKLNLNSVKIDFINKCSQQEPTISKQTETKFRQGQSQLNRCKIPGAIKNVYVKMKNLSFDSIDDPEDEKDAKLESKHLAGEEADDSSLNKLTKRAFIDENEKESYILAVEALQLLSNTSSSNIANQNPINSQEPNAQSLSNVQAPPLNRHCSEAIKPRALLQYIPTSSVLNSEIKTNQQNQDPILSEISQTLNTNILNYQKNKHTLPAASQINYRSFNVGTSSTMDLVLEKKCDYLADKHACIFFDEQTNHFELLNYSDNGTVVDNCLYGFNLDPSDTEDSSSDSEEATKTSKQRNNSANDHLMDTICCKNIPQMSSRPKQTRKPCNCTENDLIHERYWEGSAVLSHGSRIRFGCLEFLFIIVDYDFVSSRNLSTSPRFNHFYDLKHKKNKKIRNTVDKNELRAIRKTEYSTTSTPTFPSTKLNSKNLTNNLKKIKKNSSVSKKKLINGQIPNGKRATMRKYKIDKIESFLKLMNNKNKKNLLDLC